MNQIIKSFFIALIFSWMPIGSAESKPKEPIVILGGGVGSLTSAIYLGRAGFSPLVIEGPNPGGLLTQSHTVQNWPGAMEIDGARLVANMREQAEANGARFVNEEVIGVDFSKRPFQIATRTLDGKGTTHRIFAESCIIAMGTKPNFLNIPGEASYWGKGVSNCAICDGSLYKGKKVGIVGGGDAAVLEALYLSNIAKEVHLFVRKNSLKAVEEKRVQLLKGKGNVQFHYDTLVEAVDGNKDQVTQVLLKKRGKEPLSFSLDALFLAIGSTPNSGLFKGTLELDPQGYIRLKKDQQTSIEGVYAIGDIVDPIYKQAVSAAGDGSKAALQAQQYLSDRGAVILAQREIQTPIPLLAEDKEVIEVSSVEEFDRQIRTGGIPIVVDFYATWCGPCKRISPAIESSAHQLAGKVKFLKVNVDQFYDLSETYQVRAMPTVLLLDSSGRELQRKVGPDQISDLLKELNRMNVPDPDKKNGPLPH